MIKFEVIGIQGVSQNLKRKGAQINVGAAQGLENAAIKILAEAKANLKQNGSIATGQLRDSGRVEKQPDNSIDVAFKSIQAYFIEFGRKAGRMPPIDAITEWVVKKGLADTYSVKTQKRAARGNDFKYRAMSIAFLIAKKIQKVGSKPKPFLYPAFRQNEAQVMREINEAIRKVL
jgi:hypothetical protein